LIDEAEQSFLAGALAVALPDARDVRDQVEVETPVRRQRDGQRVLDIEEVGQEEVAVAVEREARVAARVAEVVVVADQLCRPRVAAVEADALEHAGNREVDVRDLDDVLRIRRVDGDRLLRLVRVALADVDVGRSARLGGAWDN
jgi:hypothetical protein